MYKKVLFIAITTIAFAACNQKQSGSLDQKKTELDSLLKVQTELNAKVSKLRNEIDAMDSTTMKSKKMKSVEVTKASLQEFKHYIEATGVIESDQNSIVTAKIQGFVINTILVKPGDHVNAGQLLATVDNSTMIQQIEAAKVQYNIAKTAYERQKNLWDKQIGSEIQYLQAKAQKEGAERQLASQEAGLANTNIIAPFSGVIDEVKFKVGENTANFSPSQNVGGIRIVNNSKLKITAKLADTYISKVHSGDRVKVIIPDLGNKEIDAIVSFIASVISDKRTFDVVIWLPANADLRPNMNANIKINDLTYPKVFVVSENIVHTSEGQKSIMVLTHEGSKMIARKMVITTGETYNGLVVVKGLKEGDEIITAGYAGINDGEEVKL